MRRTVVVRLGIFVLLVVKFGALPEALRGIVTLAYFTGLRRSEVLPLQWTQVDRARQIIRLEVGTTKSGDGRPLPYGDLPELVTMIEDAWKAHEALQQAGTICPRVFHRHGKPIRDFRKVWENACTTAGCPGKLLHDFRRTSVRNLVRAGYRKRSPWGSAGTRRGVCSTAAGAVIAL